MKNIPELETNNLEYMQFNGVLFSRWKGVNEWREVRAMDLVNTIKTLKEQVSFLEKSLGIEQELTIKQSELWQEKLNPVM